MVRGQAAAPAWGDPGLRSQWLLPPVCEGVARAVGQGSAVFMSEGPAREERAADLAGDPDARDGPSETRDAVFPGGEAALWVLDRCSSSLRKLTTTVAVHWDGDWGAGGTIAAAAARKDHLGRQGLYATIQSMNVVTASSDCGALGDVQVSPEKGTVSFGSGLQSWAFTINKFARMYATKFGVEVAKMEKRLWGDNFFDSKRKKWTTQQGDGCTRAFCQFCMEPIRQLFDAVMNEKKDKLDKVMKGLSIVLKGEERDYTQKKLLKAIMQKFPPGSDALLQMIVRKLLSPAQAQAYRAEQLYMGTVEQEPWSSRTSVASRRNPSGRNELLAVLVLSVLRTLLLDFFTMVVRALTRAAYRGDRSVLRRIRLRAVAIAAVGAAMGSALQLCRDRLGILWRDRITAAQTTTNWEDRRSLGEQQRLAIARLLYHTPQFAILDECTSAVPTSVELLLYEECRRRGITYITICHRPALEAFHSGDAFGKKRRRKAGSCTAGSTVPSPQRQAPAPAERVAPLQKKLSEGAGAERFVPGEYIVVLKNTVAPEVHSSVTAKCAAREFAIGSGPLHAKLSDGQLAELLAHPEVHFVERNQIVNVADAPVNVSKRVSCPASQTEPLSWGQKRVAAQSANVAEVFAHDPNWGKGVTVYVRDTGVRITHEEFRGWAEWSANFAGGADQDNNGHGTHCAGTIGGKTHELAEAAAIVSVKVLGDSGSGSYAGIISGVEWTVSRGKKAIANMSLGGGYSAALNQAVNAASAGVLFANAAGNDNRDSCSYSPGSAEDGICVGSTELASKGGQQIDSRSYLSNYGSCSDVFAPGSAFDSAYRGSDSAYATLSGTSMAAPHVAGVAAIALQQELDKAPLRELGAAAQQGSEAAERLQGTEAQLGAVRAQLPEAEAGRDRTAGERSADLAEPRGGEIAELRRLDESAGGPATHSGGSGAAAQGGRGSSAGGRRSCGGTSRRAAARGSAGGGGSQPPPPPPPGGSPPPPSPAAPAAPRTAEDFVNFVNRLLQRRHQLRREQKYSEGNAVLQRLRSLDVTVDDHAKRWRHCTGLGATWLEDRTQLVFFPRIDPEAQRNWAASQGTPACTVCGGSMVARMCARCGNDLDDPGELPTRGQGGVLEPPYINHILHAFRAARRMADEETRLEPAPTENTLEPTPIGAGVRAPSPARSPR